MSSDRKKADPFHGNAELSRTNEILHSILSDMGDAVVVADKDENFLVFNPAAERMIIVSLRRFADCVPAGRLRFFRGMVKCLVRSPCIARKRADRSLRKCD